MFTTVALPVIALYSLIAAKAAYNNAEHIIRYDNLRNALKAAQKKNEEDISAEDITSAE